MYFGVSILLLICIFLFDNDVEHLFIWLILIRLSLSVKCLIKSFVCFELHLTCYLLRVLYKLWVQVSLSNMWFAKVPPILYYVVFLFSSTISFKDQKNLIWMRSSFSISSFMDHVLSKKYFLNWEIWRGPSSKLKYLSLVSRPPPYRAIHISVAIYFSCLQAISLCYFYNSVTRLRQRILENSATSTFRCPARVLGLGWGRFCKVVSGGKSQIWVYLISYILPFPISVFTIAAFD